MRENAGGLESTVADELADGLWRRTQSRSNDEESEEDFDLDDVSFVDDDDDDDDNDEDDNEKETIDAQSLFFEDEDKEIDEDYELEMAALKKMNRLKRKPPAIVARDALAAIPGDRNANAEILLPRSISTIGRDANETVTEHSKASFQSSSI